MLQGGPEFAAWRASRDTKQSDDADTPRVRVEDARGHHVVTLTRGARHNALDARLRDQLDVALAEISAQDTRPIIVRGDGPSF
jgi:enoyl-CoA hydratase/carnithine racemase